MTASNILKENYINALYRRNNQGKPCVWYISKIPKSDVAVEDYFIIHGIIGTNNKINISYLNTSQKNTDNEIQSKINEKRKKGYKYLNELKDNNELPKFEELLSYLNAYLPNDRTDGNGKLLPMLAKTFDITDKTFNKIIGPPNAMDGSVSGFTFGIRIPFVVLRYSTNSNSLNALSRYDKSPVIREYAA